ncbi:MAG: rhomboid family intramembrane serine protease [Candidatus Sumerlaeia bacterium]|nr:rhomboid family intramembrane serine protease [Candidatus Sumerlaeia bacterium]
MTFLRDIDGFFARYLPPVTRRLLLLLVGVHVVLLVLEPFRVAESVRDFLVLSPKHIFPGIRLWELITYGFLHASFGHLFMNGLGLFFFGGPVEDRLGPRRYLTMLLLAIAAAGLMHTFIHFGRGYPRLVGFSAANFAILMGCLIYVPNAIVHFNFLIPIRMKWLVIGYLVLEVFGLFGRGTMGISHLGHVTGALVGLAFILGPRWRGGGPGGRGGGRRRGRVVRSRRLSMGHPGRSERASELYDDPHWRLDQ